MMRVTHSRFATRLIVPLLLLSLAPVEALAGGARLEGYLLGVDGRAAVGHRVHLIDREGRDIAQAQAGEDGVYRFRDLPAGAYSLGIESPEGRMAPVAAAPVRLGDDQLARRDVKLLNADEDDAEAVGKENKSFGIWWAGLNPWIKAGAVVGMFVVLGLVVTSLDDEKAGTPI